MRNQTSDQNNLKLLIWILIEIKKGFLVIFKFLIFAMNKAKKLN